jgi:hypothetical protein
MTIPRPTHPRRAAAGVVITLLGILLMFIAFVTTAMNNAIVTDATESVGDELQMLYQPTVTTLLQKMIGQNVRFARFATTMDVLHEGRLTDSKVDDLSRRYIGLGFMQEEGGGSFITKVALDSAAWLKKRGGGRLLVLSDGLEQRDISRLVIEPGAATGVDAYILYSRIPQPRVAEALRLAGAKVHLINSPAEVTGLIRGLNSSPPLRNRVGGTVAWILLLTGLSLIVAAFYVHRSKTTAAVVDVKTAKAESPQPSPQPLLRPLEAEVVVTIVDHPRLSARQRTICNGGGSALLVAREGTRDAHLNIPLNILDPDATEVAFELRLLDMRRVKVLNRGQVTLVAGNQAIRPASEACVLVGDPILLGPELELSVSVSPALQLEV